MDWTGQWWSKKVALQSGLQIDWPGDKPSEETHSTHASMETDVKWKWWWWHNHWQA